MPPRRLAIWFRQLSSLTRAGITIPEAIRRATGPDAGERDALASRLEAGTPPREAWPETPFLLKADAIVLAAGQLSGRFPDVCDELSTRHEAAAGLRSRMLTASLYPLFLINFAIFVGPFIVVPDFSGKTQGSLEKTISHGLIFGFGGVALFWAVVFGVRALFHRNPALRSSASRILPLWSGAAKHASYSVFAGTLASLLRAGVDIGNAWLLAGEASGDNAIAAFSRRVAATVDKDRSPPGALIAVTTVFPESFRALYLAGEVSGSLEARLDELRERHAADASSRATVAAFAYAKFLLILVMVFVAFRIISFWSGYYSGMFEIMK